jgi:S1-C subfamily serine protease
MLYSHLLGILYDGKINKSTLLHTRGVKPQIGVSKMKKNYNRKYLLLTSLIVLFGMSCGLLSRVIETSEGAINDRVETALSAVQPTQPAATQQVFQPQPRLDIQNQGFLELEQRLIQVYLNTNPSVVYILTSRSSGSGFVYDSDGHIVTNHHVVANENSFEVVFSNGQRERAVFVGSDIDSDLAVIKVDNLPVDAPPIPLAKDDLVVGQFVAAIGNPFGKQGSMSMGIVSGLERSLPSQRSTIGGGYSLPQVIQTDAPINPGNSGGPLLNLNGEVVGVNSAISTQTGTNTGVGYAIPVRAVERMVPSLIQEGQYTYPYMGLVFLGEINLDTIEQLGLPRLGAYVLHVSDGSPAYQAGIIAADEDTGLGGDLIIALDGHPVRSFGDLNSFLVFHAGVGQTVEVTLLRNGQEHTLRITLGERP